MSSHKPRGYSINDFLSWDERRELVLQPKFQRRSVWAPKAKSHLIDTVLRGLPVPLIFIRQNVDPKNRKTVREVVDGQQRLRSVISFCRDEFAVMKSQNPTHGGKTFSQLPLKTQQALLGYEFSVVLLEEVTDPDVLNIFARLNTYAQRLTPQELLNAAWYGQFKQSVYKLGQDHLEFWRRNKILGDRQIVRMAEAELATELVVTMLFGIQHRRTRIGEAYASFDDAYPGRKGHEESFRKIIDIISNCFCESLGDTMFCKRAIFFSLFCAFYHLLFGIPKTPELGRGGTHSSLSTKQLAAIRSSLLQLENQYELAKPPADLAEFVNACVEGTNDKPQRTVRTRTILDRIRAGLSSRA